MTFRLPIIALLICCSCNKSERSRLASFHYGGYSDTTVAFLDGRIYEINNHDTLAASGVKLQVGRHIVYTNKDGEFSVGTEKGIFNIAIYKEEYQTLNLTNFVSDPDQVSFAEIILVKGAGIQNAEIPAPGDK